MHSYMGIVMLNLALTLTLMAVPTGVLMGMYTGPHTHQRPLKAWARRTAIRILWARSKSRA